MNEEKLKTLYNLRDLAIPHIKKLGHKIGEWKLGPRPHIHLCMLTTCEACQKVIRCQVTLKTINKKVVDAWEVTAGSYVIGELEGNDLNHFKGNEKDYCSRFMNLI
jgi:hypothetical protein